MIITLPDARRKGNSQSPGAERSERFWIANVIYLCFALSAVLGNVTKVIVYRGSFPRW